MLSVSNLSKSYGEQVLFSNVTFNIGARDRIAVIGPNGSGKTTLFEILAGNITPDTGIVAMRKDITIGYTRQEISPFSNDILLKHVAHASDRISGLEHRIRVLQEALAEESDSEDAPRLLRELGELQHKYEAAGGYNLEHEAEVVLSGLGFRERDFLRPMHEFSGGWLMRAALARLLVLNPDMLLLDEPTNHLDLESCIWFEEYLKSYEGTVLVTSHDRAFLNRVAGKIIAIESDDVIFFHGSYDDFVLAREQDREIREATARRQDLKIKKEMRFIEKFRYKATKAAQVQSRLKALAKVDRIEVPRATKKIKFSFPEPARSGEEVIALKHIIKSYDNNTVYRDLTLSLQRHDRVALVGPNGAGKTTLLKILAGILPFEQGERRLGANVTVAYYAQHQLELLKAENSVLQEIQQTAGSQTDLELRLLLGSFLFSGEDVFKKVSVLSGGEKSRLAIAKMLIRPANFLLMDEPTNHLDINSREMLIDALDAYKGTLCFVTHDRTVIREIANRIIDIRDGTAAVFNGNYDEYLAWKEKHSDIEQPLFDNADMSVVKDRASVKIQRRKAAEGELRNSYYRGSSPLKKRIGEIETEMSRLEAEYRDLETYFATPEMYGDSAEITAKTKRHHEIKQIINKLSTEWEKLSIDAEAKKQVYEQAKRDLEDEFEREKEK
jgi:ATP-binding cassette, subfamily F, member 3